MSVLLWVVCIDNYAFVCVEREKKKGSASYVRGYIYICVYLTIFNCQNRQKDRIKTFSKCEGYFGAK